MSAKTSTIILFNPMPVKHPVALLNKKTVSLQVPLVNVPLSLLAIARMVRDDFDVRIINAVVDVDYKEQILKACKNALCLAVSSMTCYQIRDGIDVCAAVKEHYPALPIIWGGYHPSTEPMQTLRNPHIDIVIRGQGELTFKEVMERLQNKESLNGIPGVSYKEGRKLLSNPEQKFENINVFPPIPYDMIDVERHIKGYKFGARCLDYYASQGCASGCNFCSEPVFCARHWSGLAPGTVVSELEHLAKTYNIDTFMIRDSDFFLNVRRVKELCRLLIEKGLGIRLTSVNGRMELLSRLGDEVWALVRRAGIYEIFIGFESGYQEALDAMNKGAKVSQIKACVDKCIKHNIDIRGSFMVGIPGMDAKEEVKSTFNEIHRIICAYGEKGRLSHLDILLSFFTPYPHTPLYEASLKYGLKPLDTLEEWGDFDQFDFKAPWFPEEYFDIVKEFRDGMPWNSGCEFEDWCGFYKGIVERLDRI
ncbi:MAG: radical SAM protein [Candidatus Methanoperedens sp.]|nr:radical SAM protein [Candidatus Methanoperedens sp.]MCZ7395387.1 radical SAM protein [Candidatus Methanoperedens sp.]